MNSKCRFLVFNNRFVSIVLLFAYATIADAVVNRGHYFGTDYFKEQPDLVEIWSEEPLNIEGIQAPARDYTLTHLGLQKLRPRIEQAPLFNSGSPPVIAAMVMPDGKVEPIAVFESQTARNLKIYHAPNFRVEVPNLPELVKTYQFKGVENPSLSGRFQVHPDGTFGASYFTDRGPARIARISNSGGGSSYASFYNKDRTDGADVFPHSDSEHIVPDLPLPVGLRAALIVANAAPAIAESGSTLRTFRLAVQTTGEYSQARDIPGNNVSPEMDVINSVIAEIDNVNELFGREFAVNLDLVAVRVNPDPDTDFFEPDEPDVKADNCELRDQNIAIDDIVGSENYDIGFAFGTGNGSGCASYVACKANKYLGGALIRVVDSSGVSVAPGNATSVLAHEMGHQLDARHTFSGSACLSNEYNAQAAYEPGSGTTIMSYFRLCNEDRDGDGALDANEDILVVNGELDPGEDVDGDGNLDVDEDRNGNGILDNDNVDATVTGRYYHAISLQEIINYTTGLTKGTVLDDNATCGTETALNNAPPSVVAGLDYTIPRNTAFTLTGSATDPDGDPLQYVWEQFDPGVPARPIDSASEEDGPLFRSIPPISSLDAPNHSRTFPRFEDYLIGNQREGEILPTVDREMNFRLTARDGNGGVSADDMKVTVQGSQFSVTRPNGNGELIGVGCTAPVTWNVGGGSVANEVDILLSEDAEGGSDFNPLFLGANNDGEQLTTFSCNLTSTSRARVKVAAADNIFFDVSDNNFFISRQAPVTTLTAANGGEVDEACAFTVTFAASVTDDCGVSTDGVQASTALLTGIADLGPVTLNKTQVDAANVSVEGSFMVSNVGLDDDGNPASVQIDVSSVDACGIQGPASRESDIVTVVDNIPPTINVTLNPNELWSPNHSLTEVTAHVEVTDNCPSPTFALTSAESNEPDNGLGDGDQANDIQDANIGTPDTLLRLRAERSGTGNGRIYNITYTATDASNNTNADSEQVAVPHN